MIRRQARFLGKPVRTLDMETRRNSPKSLKSWQIYQEDTGSTDPEGLELAMQRGALHADEFRRARDVA